MQKLTLFHQHGKIRWHCAVWMCTMIVYPLLKLAVFYALQASLNILHEWKIWPNMKFYSFSLLMLATVLIGKAYGCHFERILHSPHYEQITQPKRILSVSRPHGICVASDGKFAAIPHNHDGNFHLYYSCGKLIKIVRLPPGHGSTLVDCTFSGGNLYITGHSGKKIYKYTENENS